MRIRDRYIVKDDDTIIDIYNHPLASMKNGFFETWFFKSNKSFFENELP